MFGDLTNVNIKQENAALIVWPWRSFWSGLMFLAVFLFLPHMLQQFRESHSRRISQKLQTKAGGCRIEFPWSHRLYKDCYRVSCLVSFLFLWPLNWNPRSPRKEIESVINQGKSRRNSHDRVYSNFTLFCPRGPSPSFKSCNIDPKISMKILFHYPSTFPLL